MGVSSAVVGNQTRFFYFFHKSSELLPGLTESDTELVAGIELGVTSPETNGMQNLPQEKNSWNESMPAPRSSTAAAMGIFSCMSSFLRQAPTN